MHVRADVRGDERARSLSDTHRRQRSVGGALSRLSVAFWITLGLVWVHPALADPIGPLSGPVWAMWGDSPIIVGGCLLMIVLYLRGYLQRRARGERVHPWRAVSYFSGVLLTYLVLQSPMDALSDHVFWIHRVQHVALHHWIPMLLALSAPIPELVRGLPRRARLHGLRPILRNRGVRLTWAFIQHPVVAPTLFVGLIYLWLTPSIFDYATVNGTVHDLMHFSMLIEGIPFWWLMLCPKPGRLFYGARLIILWAIMLPQIMVGAYITFTPRVLYPLYALMDRGWVSSYMVDQHLGGLVVWIPTSMMSVLAAVIVIRWWMQHERAPVLQPVRPGVPPPGQATAVDLSSQPG